MRLIDADDFFRQFSELDIEPYNNVSTIEERPKGKWIEVDNGLVSGRCSSCGWEAVIMETDVCGMPFCPNCGARMECDV